MSATRTRQTRVATITRYTCGVQIYQPAGIRDIAAIRDQHGTIQYTGTYRQCVVWCHARGLRCVS